MLPPACLLAYVEVAAAFATQRHHLNVSLTAIGLQWTLSDYLRTDYGRSAYGGRSGDVVVWMWELHAGGSSSTERAGPS